MLLTEEEAKQTTCCLSMATDIQDLCRARNCMAWRWGTSAKGEWREGMGAGFYDEIKRGYCGLAGKVEK